MLEGIVMPQKTNYFYIDESGSINNDSKVFIHGCIKTDSPSSIEQALTELKKDILDDIYYSDFRERILNEGFHATENNMDMRADMYKLLPLLDYRAYIVLVNKESDYFKNLIASKEEHEIFEYSLKKLILDRINKNKGDKNLFFFEQLQISKKSLDAILDDIFDGLDETHDCHYEIVGKEEENMGVVDYINFVFYHLLAEVNPMKRMKQNFELISPKIAVINILNSNVFLSRKKPENHQITIDNLFQEFSGVAR